MVMPAADADRVLLDDPQPRMRLARVDYLRASARDCINESACRRRDSGEQLNEVERCTLANQQSRELALDFRKHIASFKLCAFRLQGNEMWLSASLSHHRLDEDAAGEDHPRLFDGNLRATHRSRRDSPSSRDIALPNILGKRALDEFGRIELLEQFHQITD